MTEPVIDINGNLIPPPEYFQVLEGKQDGRPAQGQPRALAAQSLRFGGWQGRDVSSWDPSNFPTNLHFYISKVTESNSYVSSGWAARRARIRAAGKVYGSYHYAQPGNGAHQADFYLSVAGMPKDDEMPVWLDYEVSGLGAGFRDAFCNQYKDRVGVAPGLYTGESMWNSDLHRAKGAARWVWLAHYGVQAPTYPCDIWQWQGGPDLDTAYTDPRAMTVGRNRVKPPVVTGPPGVYPYGPDGHRPVTSQPHWAQHNDSWDLFVRQFYSHTGATTNVAALKRWHVTHGGDPRFADWDQFTGKANTLLAILPVGSPGFLT